MTHELCATTACHTLGYRGHDIRNGLVVNRGSVTVRPGPRCFELTVYGKYTIDLPRDEYLAAGLMMALRNA